MKISNPATGEVLSFEETPLTEVDSIFDRATEAHQHWSRLSVPERVRALAPVLDRIRAERESFARRISEEMGKPIKFARLEVERSIAEFEHMLSIAESALASFPAPEGRVFFEPLGVVAVISPWNFPIMLPLRSIVPALLAGNAVIYKPSELSPNCGRALSEVFCLQPAVSPVVPAYGGKELGAAIVSLPVRAVCFTGSSAVGKQIARASAETLKHLVLELGGIDPAIVLEDADIALSAKRIVMRNSGNCGQVCNAVKRVYVAQSRLSEFLEHAREASGALNIGDPLDERTDMGPLVSGEQLARTRAFIDDALKRGAAVVCGGNALQRPGYFHEHTILTDVPPNARLLNEEAFGPVLPVMPFSNVEEAVRLANSTPFGLNASLFTRDPGLAERIIPLLEVGGVSINDHVAGGPGTPWGGAKQSGLGRMKTPAVLQELSNIKYVRTAGAF